MPQLDLLIYFHEFSWLVFTFFLFYFVFLKYFLPKLIIWMKFQNKLVLYHLSFFKQMNQLIINNTLRSNIQNIYKIFLCLNLLTNLKTIFNYSYKLVLMNNLTSLERTQFLIIKKLK